MSDNSESDSDENENNEGYKVGYGRPPLKSRWKPGQPGNPTGKKKGTLNLKTILQRECERVIKTMDGTELSALQAIIRTQMGLALKGGPRAIENFLDRVERMSKNAPDLEERRDITEDDEAIIDEALRRRSGRSRTDDLGGDEGSIETEEADEDE